MEPEPLSADARQSAFEQAVAISLHLWPALRLAVDNEWGGRDSADKRDWLAGVVVDLFPPLTRDASSAAAAAARQPTTTTTAAAAAARLQPEDETVDRLPVATSEPEDPEDVEEVLLQVLDDEFGVLVEDGSERQVARDILRYRQDVLAGDTSSVVALQARFDEFLRVHGGKRIEAVVQGDSDDDDDDDDDSDDDDNDEDMDAPPLVKNKKAEPEVDEDGFTMVKRR